MTPMNKQWNSIQDCMPKDGDSPEVMATKVFNKKVCADRKPFFFIYRYSSTKADYDQFVKQFDQKLQQRYNIPLDQLFSSNNLSPELKKVKERYYNRCPVDLSPGTVNRIAWAVNKKFEDFSKIPLVKFDKDLIKSGVLYSKSDFYKVKEVYFEYKKSLTYMAKKYKQDIFDEEEQSIVDKSILSALYQKKFYEACPNEYMLCDILVDLLYDNNSSKSVVWDMCGDTIIKNLLAKAGGYVEYPQLVESDEEFGCCRKKFRMKKICLGGQHGEI